MQLFTEWSFYAAAQHPLAINFFSWRLLNTFLEFWTKVASRQNQYFGTTTDVGPGEKKFDGRKIAMKIVLACQTFKETFHESFMRTMLLFVLLFPAVAANASQ